MKNRIEKYGIVLRLVEESDAEFIVKLRTDSTKSKFISATSNSIEDQINWIKNYKKRETEKKEFYFIAEKNAISYGTVRIYNITNESFESGSWVFKEDTPPELPSLAGILSREFAFEELPLLKFITLSVRKGNKKVLRYHTQVYECEKVGEDEENYYFHLSKEKWLAKKDFFLKMLVQ